MKTIEAVRLENFKRLVSEIKGTEADDPRPVDVAAALGISKVYAWQLMTGARTNIADTAARLIERKMEKPEGWMDTDFDLWPFHDTELLAAVQALPLMRRAEIQGAIRDKLSQFARPAPAPTPIPPPPMTEAEYRAVAKRLYEGQPKPRGKAVAPKLSKGKPR